MPPERIEGEKKVAYDVRADVWSLGITLVGFSSSIRFYLIPGVVLGKSCKPRVFHRLVITVVYVFSFVRY